MKAEKSKILILNRLSVLGVSQLGQIVLKLKVFNVRLINKAKREKYLALNFPFLYQA